MTVCRGGPPLDLELGAQVQFWLNPEDTTPWLLDTEGNALDPTTFSFTVEEGAAGLTRVAADPAKGFHWPYYLYVPDAIRQPAVLLVEPNNTGAVSDDPGVHEKAANDLIKERRLRAQDIGSPLLMPAFPRPETHGLVYTQSLDRDTLLTNLPGLVRIDLANARYFEFTSDRYVLGFTVSGSADGLMLDGLHCMGDYLFPKQWSGGLGAPP